jgi:exopolysaccharide production protein ExoQ
MTTWNGASPVGRRRIRGGEIPIAPGAPSWRDQKRAQREALKRMLAGARAQPGEDRSGSTVRIAGFNIDIDGVFAFLLFVPLLFIAQWGTLGAAAIAALAPAYVFMRRKRLVKVMLPRLFLFIIPALFVFSVVWSEAPRETFKYALQLGITATAGILLSSARNQEAVLRGLAAAFLAYAAASVALGGSVAVGVGAGGYAFSGLGASKNVVADIASTGLIIALAVLFMAIRARSTFWICLAAVSIPLDLYCVAAARSAGAMVGVGVALLAMLGLASLIFVGRAVRAWLTASLTVVLIWVGLSYSWLSQLMIEFAANLFDKDPTLTGRTYLWYRANDLINEKPMLGRGYNAFWLQGNTEAEGLWRYFGIENRGGFSFHNTAVELLVTVGWVGLVVVAAVVAIALVALVRRFVVSPSMALVCWTAIFLYQFSRTPVETVGLAPFYFSTALAFAALGAAFARVDLRKAARAAYQPRTVKTEKIVQVWPVEQVPSGWANPRWTPQTGSLRLLKSNAKAAR